jgi:hypothetical protein
MTNERTPRRDADAADTLVVEVRIMPLADGDIARRDRQLHAIVNLLQGVLARRQDRSCELARNVISSSHDDP